MKNIIFSLILSFFCTTTTNLFSQKGEQQSKSSELRKKVHEMDKKRQNLIDEYLKEHRPDYWQMEMTLKKRIQEGGPLPSYKEKSLLSDLIIVGEVVKIEYNAEGPYHTWVTVRVDSIIRGKEEKHSITVKLVTGPTNYEGKHIKLGHIEPEFFIGENVLLFLSTIPRNLWLVGGPEYFENPSALTFHSTYFFEKYKVVPNGYEPQLKFKIDQGNIIFPNGKTKDLWEFIHDEGISDSN